MTSAVVASSVAVLSLRRTLPGSATFPAAKGARCAGDDDWVTYAASPYAACEWLLVHSAAVALPSPSTDSSVWLLEQLRLTVAQLNGLMGCLAAVCTSASCPVMSATVDWEFLCAAHGAKPRKCCAMDYCCHTLTAFSALLNDSEAFPSRATVAAKGASVFPSVCRRLYRLFAHAYHHHREAWQAWEQRTRATQRFLALVQRFQLMDDQQLTPAIPLQPQPPLSTA